MRSEQIPTEQSERVRCLLGRRSDYHDASQWLAAIGASLTGERGLEDDTLEALQQALRGHYSVEYTKLGDDHDAHVELWRLLSEQFVGHARLKGIYADTLLICGRDRELCLRTFLEAVNADPRIYPEHAGDFYETAEELGGELWFAFRLAELRFATSEDDGDDFTNELTRELLAEFGADPNRVSQIGATVERSPVRRGKVDDEYPIAAIHVAAWRATYAGIVPDETLEQLSVSEFSRTWRRRLKAPPGARRIWVYQDKDGIAGFAASDMARDDDLQSANAAELTVIYVAPDRLREGIGSALLRQIEELLRRCGFARLVLWVASSNTGALAFYAAHRLVPDGATKEKQRDGYSLSELRLRKEL